MEAAKKRLEDQELDPESESRANKVHDIAEQIGQKLAKAEQLGDFTARSWIVEIMPRAQRVSVCNYESSEASVIIAVISRAKRVL